MEINLTDTHTHLYAEEFDTDQENCIKAALQAGVQRFFLPHCDSSSTDRMLQLALKYPLNFFPMMGLHPCSVKENYKFELVHVEEWLSKHSFYAIGEIGIDLYWEQSYKNEQEIVLKKQIELSLEYGLPIVLHSRNSFNIIYSILSLYKNTSLNGIFHCFSGNTEQAKKIVDLGFFLGIGGVVTFKNSGLDEVVRNINLDHLVLETDAPYLAPVPFRGKRNQPAYLKIIAETIAKIKETDLKTVAEITTANSRKIFKI
jgi:TatD DNase family protein